MYGIEPDVTASYRRREIQQSVARRDMRARSASDQPSVRSRTRWSIGEPAVTALTNQRIKRPMPSLGFARRRCPPGQPEAN
jgi:hypothetical protein